MTRRWPDSLPRTTSEAFSLSPVDQSIRTDMEVGAQRVRRRTLSRLDRVQMGWVLTDAQMQAFRTWYEDGRVSIAGDSDDLFAWSLAALTRTSSPILTPDLVPADRLLETTATDTHTLSLGLAEANANSVPLLIRASVKAAGRSAVRFGLVDRTGALQGIDVDLATGAVTATSGAPAAAQVEARGNGWWRITVQASTGTGLAMPAARLGLLNDLGESTYAGDTAKGVDAAEVQSRIVTGYDLFVPCDADGKALGAAGGSAWFWVPIATGGGLRTAEARFAGPYTARAGAGLIWQVSAQLEVRNA